MSNNAIWVSAGSAIVVAFVTGLWAWIASRSKTRSDIQQTVNDGFGKLISELQEELTRRGETEADLRHTVSSQDSLIYRLQMKVRKLAHIVTTLHNFIVMKGLTPPSYVMEEDEGPPQ